MAWNGGVTNASTSPAFTIVPSLGNPPSGGERRPLTEACTNPLAFGSGMMRPGSSRVLRWVAACVSAVRIARMRCVGLGHEQRAVGKPLRDFAGRL